jgi:hypothetical protein
MRDRSQFLRDRERLRVSMHGGRIYTDVENRYALLVVRGLQVGTLQLQAQCESAAIEIAAFLLWRSVRNILRLLQRFEAIGLAAVQRVKTTRGRAHPAFQARVFRFNSDSDRIIRQLVDARAIAGKCTGTKE